MIIQILCHPARTGADCFGMHRDASWRQGCVLERSKRNDERSGICEKLTGDELRPDYLETATSSTSAFEEVGQARSDAGHQQSWIRLVQICSRSFGLLRCF